MCNHYRLTPDAIPTWREYAGFGLPDEWSETKLDIWPKYQAPIVRTIDGVARLDQMAWGVPTTVPGKRPGSKLTKYVTNVRNLSSPFWRSMLAKPEQRCLVPFTEFAEPKIGQGRAEYGGSRSKRPLCPVLRASGGHLRLATCSPS